MKKRIFHRGYTIENTTGVTNEWTSSIKGNPVSGTLTEVKKSVDWWLDMSTFIPPQKFSSQTTKSGSTSENYRGFTIRNDTGKSNEWYLVLRGQLLKGNATSIKQYLDKVIEKQTKAQ
ncbi:DUF3319 domain-containing protein [Photobacterium lucens]|uniref:DUF3319 domain-containing protein n=1 Tax=Photobacterium lucens TaxID=2562949 RepID=UPI0006B5E90A|nr:DUF3319 domain-containing protein [Photobacterium lucens]KPA51723.1 hypothetical protein VT25_16595 [Photobacterium leiognathi subsp. mandapamensis]MBP2701097.1 DUF3319 domain-containing protein [Vibrio parahaemolyticus]MZG57775.1 DUF3319 domain-containing protein [Photobacterium lucens]MZG81978.1 DUF3319 domain-containing protein [Photobacterium lucens]PSV22007.1 DUF3319 domain-containing protein [Photobacterium leiognathi subsp. mandapamensis]